MYSVLGLQLVCSQPLPRQGPASGSEALVSDQVVGVDLQGSPFDRSSVPAARLTDWPLVFESDHRIAQGEPSLRIWRDDEAGLYRFRYADGCEFFVDDAGTHIWARWPAPYTLDDVETYLLGPILGFVLRLRGVLTLHASSVVIDGGAVAIAGAPGAGKSTTAAAFALSGFPMLSDDIVSLDARAQEFWVQPDGGYVSLWPASFGLLGSDKGDLPRLSRTWDKRYLDLGSRGLSAETTPRPLVAIYVLMGDRVDAREPVIVNPEPREAFMSVLGHTYAHLLDRGCQALEFDLLAKLLPTLRVAEVYRPEIGATPFEICRSIADDLRGVEPAGLARA